MQRIKHVSRVKARNHRQRRDKTVLTSFAVYSSEVGYIRIAQRDERVVALAILSETPADMGRANDYLDRVYTQIIEYLRGERSTFNIEIDISTCTEFQQKVLNALQQIPYAQRRTYKEVATAIGKPNAARAVGMACNRNPIAIVIPCHRVIGSKGNMVGYAFGVPLKRHLLALESAE